jgi:hypothetical protein
MRTKNNKVTNVQVDTKLNKLKWLKPKKTTLQDKPDIIQDFHTSFNYNYNIIV